MNLNPNARMRPSTRINVKKIAAGGMLAALAVALSGFSIPMGASKCFPIQHMVNVLAGVFLGPSYGVSIAFSASLLRNILGTGSLLAFPGSMAGAFLCALLFKKTKKLFAAYFGEVFGTGIIGAVLCYPVAALFMNQSAALFFYVLPFLLSTVCGTVMAFILIEFMRRTGLFPLLHRLLEDYT